MRIISCLILFTFSNAWVSCTWYDSLTSSVTQTVVSSAKTLKKGALKIAGSGICLFTECCNDDFIPGDIHKLHTSLQSRVYGQHLVEDVVVNAIQAHWSKHYQPKKALTLSFHGWPGGGKNYVSKFIMDSLYKLGDKSIHVHTYVARVHFPLNAKVKEYQDSLYNAIKNSVSSCGKQLFVFDEVDKMPKGLLNVIKPMIDYHDSVDGVDYRRAIFIFLSNTGAHLINDQYLKIWREDGKSREDLQLKDFEQLIQLGAFNEEGWLNQEGVLSDFARHIVYNHFATLQTYYYRYFGGFQQSDTIRSNLIDHFIPFLPMERRQVRMCVIDEFRQRKVASPKERHIEEAMDFVDWGPSDLKLFSKTGCKRISQKVGAMAAKYYGAYDKDEL